MENASDPYVNKIKTAFADIRFPATKEQLLQRKGDARVEVAEGKNVTVRDALRPISAVSFETPEALLNEISTAHALGWPEQ